MTGFDVVYTPLPKLLPLCQTNIYSSMCVPNIGFVLPLQPPAAAAAMVTICWSNARELTQRMVSSTFPFCETFFILCAFDKVHHFLLLLKHKGDFFFFRPAANECAYNAAADLQSIIIRFEGSSCCVKVKKGSSSIAFISTDDSMGENSGFFLPFPGAVRVSTFLPFRSRNPK